MSLSRIIKQLLLILLLPALALSAEGKEFTVVIDPGHGGKDAGALGRKTNEKTINLAVAKQLRDLLRSNMNDVNVIMTRSNDTFVTLQGRADMAYLIFIMLFITFCRVKPHEFRITALSWSLLSVQIIGALALYFIIAPMSVDVAQGTFICVFCPTATAAPVITGMLGGSVPRLATFSIISNIAVALLAPVIFTLMGSDAGIPFSDALLTISAKVMPLIILPLVLALCLLKISPKVHRAVAEKQAVSFYIWAVSLFIVVGRAVSFIMDEPSEAIPEMIILAIFSGIVCCAQFWIGRKIGRRCGDKIAGAQGLGQKNTVLAIWMALTYLHPVSSVAPAAYVAWQNTINSAQLYFKMRRENSGK